MAEKLDSSQNSGRLAGVFFLLNILTIGFSVGYVRSNLIVSGDAVTTANNILSNEFIFRLGIVSNILSQIFLLFFGLTIYGLFKNVNKQITKVFLTALIVAVAIAVVNSLNNLGAVLVLGNADYLKAFGQEQLTALMMIFLRLNNAGMGLLELFAAIYTFSFGLLIIKSKYIPRIFGVLMIIGACGFILNTFTKILFPTFNPVIMTRIAMYSNALWGIPTVLWLLIMGVKKIPSPKSEV